MTTWSPYEEPRKTSVLSLAPLIDVTFILLIFFMLVTQFSRFSPVDLSVSKTEQIIQNRTNVNKGTVKRTQKLHLKNDGTFLFNENTATTLPELVTALQNYAQTLELNQTQSANFEQEEGKKPLILIETEDKVIIQQLLDVVAKIKQLQIYSIKFIVKNENETTPVQ